MVTIQDLRTFVNGSELQLEFMGTCLVEATSLVNTFIGAALVPVEVFDRAVLETAAELFHRKNAPHGTVQLATFDGAAPQRIPRDPMSNVYGLLRPFVGQGLA